MVKMRIYIFIFLSIKHKKECVLMLECVSCCYITMTRLGLNDIERICEGMFKWLFCPSGWTRYCRGEGGGRTRRCAVEKYVIKILTSEWITYMYYPFFAALDGYNHRNKLCGHFVYCIIIMLLYLQYRKNRWIFTALSIVFSTERVLVLPRAFSRWGREEGLGLHQRKRSSKS